MRLGTSMTSLLWLLRPYTTIASHSRRGAIVHWHGGLLLRNLALCIRMSISVAWGLLATIGASVIIRMTIVTTSWLRDVWDHLHSPRHYSCRATASGSIRGCGRPPKPLGELLEECATDIVGGNMNSISNSKDDQGAFRGKRKARVRSIETSTGGFLNLSNSDTSFANDRTNQNVRDQ